jgi:hypothetical protein
MIATSKEYADISWDFSLWLNNDEKDLTLTKTQDELPTRRYGMQSDYVENEIPYGKVAEIVFERPPLRIEMDPWGISNEDRHHMWWPSSSRRQVPPLRPARLRSGRAVIAKAKAAQ